MINRKLQHRAASLFALVTTCLLVGGCNQPSFNTPIGPEQEKTIGDWAAAQIQSEATGPIDPSILATVTAITKRLDAAVPSMAPPSILISDSDTYTVSSLPGGWVVISAKIVTLFQGQPDALAGLLAHEYAHVESDDAAKLMIAALGSDTLNNMTAQGKYTDASNVAVQLMNFGHSSDDEYKADQEGVRIAVAAGYDPRGLQNAIAVLQAVVPITDAQWLVVHPVTSKRLKFLGDDVSGYKAEEKSEVPG